MLEGKSDFYYLKKSQCIEGDELRKECKVCEILPLCNGGCFYQNKAQKIKEDSINCNKRSFYKQEIPLLDKIITINFN